MQYPQIFDSLNIVLGQPNILMFSIHYPTKSIRTPLNIHVLIVPSFDKIFKLEAKMRLKYTGIKSLMCLHKHW